MPTAITPRHTNKNMNPPITSYKLASQSLPFFVYVQARNAPKPTPIMIINNKKAYICYLFLCLHRSFHRPTQRDALLFGGSLHGLPHEITVNIPSEFSLHSVTFGSSDLSPNIINELIRRSECHLSHNLFTDHATGLRAISYPILFLSSITGIPMLRPSLTHRK